MEEDTKNKYVSSLKVTEILKRSSPDEGSSEKITSKDDDISNKDSNKSSTLTESKLNNNEKDEDMGSSQMLCLLDEFTKIYSDRLNRVEETASKCDENTYLQVIFFLFIYIFTLYF